MEIKIKSIHFDATEKLEQFITKKGKSNSKNLIRGNKSYDFTHNK